MGRKPKIRQHYMDDAQLLLRLAHAVELDDARPIEWRKAIIAKLEDLSGEFLKAPKAA